VIRSELATYSVDGVELPVGSQVREAERVDVLVDGQSNLDEKVHNHEALGTDLEWQNLDRIGDEKTRPGQSVGDRENPDHGNDTLTSSLAALLLLLGRADGPDDEAHAHGCSGGNEKRAATNAVNEQSAGDGDNEGQDGKTTVETELSVAIGYANAVVYVGGVVGGKSVARPLGEQTERRKEHKPVPVALGLEEVEVGRVFLVLEFKTKRLLDLGVFELDSGIVDVTIGVVLAKHLEGFLVPLLRDQPTW
jgi:hypothetical protein